MINLPGVLSAALEVEQFCKRRQWRFCFIGGISVQRWGQPRLTQDVDLTLITGFGHEEEFVDVLLQVFPGRRPDTKEFAITHRVLLARTSRGIDVDVAMGAFPFEERTVTRASAWSWDRGGESLTICSAEDLLVHKVFAGRDRDWADAESVLIRQHGKLDFNLVRAELLPLLELKEEPAALDRLTQMIEKVDRRLGTKP